MRFFPGLVALLFVSRMALAADESHTAYIALQDKLYDPETRTLDVAAQPLSFYRQSILAVNYPPIDELASDPRASVGTIEALGSVAGKRVFTVDYPSGLLVIVAEQQHNLFLPVLYVHRRVSIELLEIINAGGEEFLAYVGDQPGTGNFKDEFYFSVVDGKLQRIAYETQLDTELDRRLPEGYGVWKGGGFDIRTLTFRQNVWKAGDANAQPSGGEITVNFDFINGAFVVESSEWQQAATP